MVRPAGLPVIPPLTRRYTLPELLAERSWQRENKTWLIEPETGREISYREFERDTWRIANALYDLGVRRGDRVAILLPNGIDFIRCLFGVLKAGAVAEPVNTRLRAAELEYVVGHSEVSVLFTNRDFLPELEPILGSLPALGKIILLDDGPEPYLNASDLFARYPEDQSPGLAATHQDPDDEAILFYTSGTTGRPKGVLLTHHNVVTNSNTIASWTGITERDRAMCVMPLFHLNGQVVTTFTPLWAGASVVVPGKFSASRFFPTIAHYRVTFTGTVATMLSMLLHTPDADRATDGSSLDLSCLRIVFCGSAPVPVEVQRSFERTFKVPVIEGYGMTETTCRSTFNPVPPPAKLRLGEDDGYRKLGSCGLPIENEVKVVDENDREIGPNQIGEVIIRGENVMKGYFKNHEATAQAMAGGWLHTGDMAYFDNDGYLFIVDRKKDLIIRGGENIYPREIDEVLYRHPAVRDAAAIGIPDPLWGEELVAVVSLKEGISPSPEIEADIAAFCARHLADYKRPKQFRFLDEIPKGPSGKLLRRSLVEFFAKNQPKV